MQAIHLPVSFAGAGSIVAHSLRSIHPAPFHLYETGPNRCMAHLLLSHQNNPVSFAKSRGSLLVTQVFIYPQRVMFSSSMEARVRITSLDMSKLSLPRMMLSMYFCHPVLHKDPAPVRLFFQAITCASYDRRNMDDASCT